MAHPTPPIVRSLAAACLVTCTSDLTSPASSTKENQMKRLSLFVVALAFVAVGCSKSSTSPSTPTNPTFTATLSAANEVPPITGAEAGGRGDATITFVVTKDAAGNIT